MCKIIPKLVIGRVCLISLTLLCCVFTNENAFSRRKWEKSNLKVSYDQKDKSINFDFLFYSHNIEENLFQYLYTCDFFYREKGDQKMIPLILINTKVGITESWIQLLKKEQDDNILFCNPKNNPKAIIIWPECTLYDIEQLITNVGKARIARMRIKWDLSKSSKVVDLIHITGNWKILGVLGEESISGNYPVTMVKSYSKTIDDASALMPEISDRVRVSGEADAINVTGAGSGENIKVYTISGVEIKSVVATDDAVKIKLPTNQLYIVKAGQKRYKVAF